MLCYSRSYLFCWSLLIYKLYCWDSSSASSFKWLSVANSDSSLCIRSLLSFNTYPWSFIISFRLSIFFWHACILYFKRVIVSIFFSYWSFNSGYEICRLFIYSLLCLIFLSKSVYSNYNKPYCSVIEFYYFSISYNCF